MINVIADISHLDFIPHVIAKHDFFHFQMCGLYQLPLWIQDPRLGKNREVSVAWEELVTHK